MKQAKFFVRGLNCALLAGCLLLTIIVSSCGCNRDKDDEYGREVSQDQLDSLSNIKVSIIRYEKDLFTAPPDSLKEKLLLYKDKYKGFYSAADLEDPMNILAMKQYVVDPTIRSLYNEVMKQYPSVAWLEADYTEMFRRIKVLVPDWKVPSVYTYVSGGDMQYPVKYADDRVIIALDLFLGHNYPVYQMWGLPVYITNRMTKEYVVLSTATEIGRAYVDRHAGRGKSMLDQMIYEGKLLYFTDVAVPDALDSLRIGYSGQQLAWAEKNQGNVWSFFIEKKLLHTTEMRDINKFIGEAPFTSAFSKNSAPRIGRYIGWQIVRAYMAKNKDVTVPELLKNKNAQEILNKSGYKPKKEE